jgi:hypothetical protein
LAETSKFAAFRIECDLEYELRLDFGRVSEVLVVPANQRALRGHCRCDEAVATPDATLNTNFSNPSALKKPGNDVK